VSVVCTQLSNSESLRLDLWETNRNQLLMAGVLPEHIELAGICTGCNTDRFFSHRKEHGKTGRFPVIVGLSKRNSPNMSYPEFFGEGEKSTSLG
jgi:copper oxidase (laccase) domain-containing protein